MEQYSNGIYEIKDIMRIMRISRNTAYKLLQQEGVPYIRVGGRYKIPTDKFNEWLSKQFAHLQCTDDSDTLEKCSVLQYMPKSKGDYYG